MHLQKNQNMLRHLKGSLHYDTPGDGLKQMSIVHRLIANPPKVQCCNLWVPRSVLSKQEGQLNHTNDFEAVAAEKTNKTCTLQQNIN